MVAPRLAETTTLRIMAEISSSPGSNTAPLHRKLLWFVS